MPRVGWSGVYPAVTTQFVDNPARDVDLEATSTVMRALVRDGVSGLIICGTVGEGTSLSPSEKAELYRAARDAAGSAIPVLGGVAEHSAGAAAGLAREAERAGLDGIMVMPPLSYASQPRETAAFYRAVAARTSLPIMVYNNPPIYRVDVTPAILADLADVENIVAFKDSAGDTRRFVDLQNACGDRFVLFAGLDDVILESILVGAVGWVSGMSNAFPAEGNALFKLAISGRFAEAMPLYRWFMPLLHLDARPDLVQCIKYCEWKLGRGSALTREPRLPLDDESRAEIDGMLDAALRTRPVLPNA